MTRKKMIIMGATAFVVIGSVVASRVTSDSCYSTEVASTTTVLETTESSILGEIITHETTTRQELITRARETITTTKEPETTTKKAKKVTRKVTRKRKVETTTAPRETVVVTTRAAEVTTRPTPVTTTKTINNTVPSQTQGAGMIGSNNVAFIKNTIMNNFAGTYDSNIQNLAIYMANNNKTDAQSTINSLCGNTTLIVTAKKKTVSVNSTSDDDMLSAALNLADSLAGSGGRYGIGISSSYSGGKYKITAVLAIQTN